MTAIVTEAIAETPLDRARTGDGDAFAAMEDLDPIELAVSGGDDYELLFTVPEAASSRLGEQSAAFRVPVARIGVVHAGAGAALRGPRGEREIADCGYDHLEATR